MLSLISFRNDRFILEVNLIPVYSSTPFYALIDHVGTLYAAQDLCEPSCLIYAFVFSEDMI